MFVFCFTGRLKNHLQVKMLLICLFFLPLFLSRMMGFLLFLAEEDEAEETKSLMKRREKKRAEKHTRKYG